MSTLPPELERRIAALESGSADGAADFDAVSWFWMILLGLALPMALLGAGWWLSPAAP